MSRRLRMTSIFSHRFLLYPLAGIVCLLALPILTAAPASADFRLCNATGSRVGVSLGYKDGENWITEGWWNIAASSCETLLKGTLVARYYYVYALDYDHGGEWGGAAFMCTRSKEFTIRGIENCLTRGYDRTGFFEIDTIEQRSWTVQLTEAGSSPSNGSQAGLSGAPGETTARAGSPLPPPRP